MCCLHAGVVGVCDRGQADIYECVQEWEKHLRSSLHPRVFAGAYWVAREVTDLLNLPSSWQANVLVAAPRLVQAPIAAASDYFTWKLAERIYGVESNASWVAVSVVLDRDAVDWREI